VQHANEEEDAEDYEKVPALQSNWRILPQLKQLDAVANLHKLRREVRRPAPLATRSWKAGGWSEFPCDPLPAPLPSMRGTSDSQARERLQ
jgi:hypothetical protein